MRTADGAHTVRVRRRGLTLVELLVASALMALVAGASVATLSGGFKVWQRLQALGQQSQWTEVAFDEIRRDLRNTRRFSLIPFEGTYSQVLGYNPPSNFRVHSRIATSGSQCAQFPKG